MIRSIVLVAATLLVSCTREDKGETSMHNEAETREIVPAVPRAMHNSVSIKRHFSSEQLKDEFSLTLHGPNYSDAEVCFTIKNAKGDTLFFRKTSGKALMSDGTTSTPTGEEEQMVIIRERMSTFFAETGFSHPPYTLNDPIKTGILGDKELWEEIENDTTCWCFEFSLNPEGRTEVIGYSRKRDTILVYDFTE